MQHYSEICALVSPCMLRWGAAVGLFKCFIHAKCYYDKGSQV